MIINRRVLYAILAAELIFLGLVILIFTNEVTRGPWYWIVIAAIAVSAWIGVFLSRRLFPKPNDREPEPRPDPPPEKHL